MEVKLETLLARISDFNSIKDPYGATHIPIYQTATFDLKKQTGEPVYDYSRSDNPTRNALEEIFAKAEEGTGSVCTNTGLSAIALLFDSILKTGDTILVEKDCYGGTYRLLKMMTDKYNINVKFCDFTLMDTLEKAMAEYKPRLVLCESPTNPGLKIIDISAVAKLTKKYNSVFAVDNSVATFASQKPLVLGADISLSSATKYISGHGSVISGVITAKDEELVKKIKYYSNACGRAQSPFDCFLISLGLPTLPYRLKIQEQAAIKIAEFLSSRQDVVLVKFPFLASHPQYEIAKRQMKICPAVITVNMSSVEKAEKFIKNTRLFGEKASFGTADSRIEYPAKISHASYSEEDLNAIGISKTTIRLSIGLEDTDDLINDIKMALG